MPLIKFGTSRAMEVPFISGGLADFEVYQIERHERMVRPNIADQILAYLPKFMPPVPAVPSAHVRWGKASDFRLQLERDEAPRLTQSNDTQNKNKKRKENPGTYQFEEIGRQTSRTRVTSDDGQCAVTFERIDKVTFKGPQDVHFVFTFNN